MMNFNFDDIKSKASELLGDANRLIKQYTPEAFSKEKQFVDALVCSMALMVVADKKVETDEVIKTMEIINDIDQISDLNMTKEAIELFEMHIESLTTALKSETKYVLETSKMIAGISRIKPYNEYPPMVIALLDIIANADGNVDPLETEMKDKIVKALS